MRKLLRALGIIALLLVAIPLIGLLILLAMPAAAQSVPAETLADPDGQFITVDGASLYVLDRGDPADPAVLLLHGFGGSTFSWRYTFDSLIAAGYRVVAFDRPPYGLADKSTDITYSSEAYVSYTVGLMDALDIEQAVLVGHSAGGSVITAVALAHPERVAGLVYVAGAVRVPGVEAFGPPQTGDGDSEGRGGNSVFSSLFDVAAQIDPASPLAQILVSRLVTPDMLASIVYGNYYDESRVTPEIIEGYTQILRVEGWEGAFLKLLTGPMGGGDAALDLSPLQSLDVPVLIQWGEQDAVVPLYVGEALHDYLDGSTLIVYPETGHLPMEENADAFNADLLAWLDDNFGE